MYHHSEIPEDLLWQIIFESDKKKHVMTTAVASQANSALNSADMKKVGLVDAHAYSLIEAKVIKTNNGNVKLVKVRNPWGKKEWGGDWSDASNKWTKATKA
jgi:calpain-15